MRRSRDLVVYVLIGGSIGFALYEAAIYRVSEDFLVKWFGLAFNTLVLFAWVIQRCRRFWRDNVFWWTITSLFFVHISCFWVILRIVKHWHLAYFLVMYLVEVPLIATVLDWTTNRFGKRYRAGRVAGHH
jgi:hypothetical protein